jgi:cytochrome P450
MQVFRWRGPAQFSLPHLSSEDDVFEGYAIPKGTTVIASLYSMHLRPDDFENPDEFDPERYVRNPFGLRDSSPALHQEGRKNTYSFGIGRRVCPGEDFAKTIIIMTVAKLLWAFDFEAIGEIDLSWETGYRPGLSNPPTKFLPRVKPRSPTRAKDIVAEFNKAEAYLAAVKEQNLS